MERKLRIVVLITMLVFLSVGVKEVMAQPYTGQVAADSCETVAGGDATPTPCQAGGNPEIYQAINFILSEAGAPALNLTGNAQADSLQIVGNPGYWNQLVGLGDPSKVAVIAIGAANMNTLGVYPLGDPGSINYIVNPQTGFQYLGTNDVNNAFPGGIVNMGGDFGFALRSVGNTGTEIWYSDPTLNADAIDHMMAFSLPQLEGKSIWISTDNDKTGDFEITFGKNAFLFAWEDRNKNHPSFDNDYNDTIFLISRLVPTTNIIPEPMTLTLLGTGFLGMVGLRRKKRTV